MEYNNMNILIVYSAYYKQISDNLLSGASEVLVDNNIKFNFINVPGALEIPAAIKFASLETNINKIFHGFIALGCIIRGETYHFEVVSNVSANSLSKLSTESLIPIGNGILTVENKEQALIRSDPKIMNKGAGAALACIELIKIKHKYVL